MLDDDDVRAALAGDSEAFERVYRDVHPRLVRYLGSLVGDDAQDVAAETWLQVAKDLRRFRGGASDLRGWIVTIGRHRALDWLRARNRRPSDPCDPAVLPEHALPDDAGEHALSTRWALDLIRRLPPDQAQAVLLRVVVGLDAPAAAKVLGKRPGAVRMATSRGLAGLSTMLTSEGATPSKASAGELAAGPGVTSEWPLALKESR